MLCTGNAVGQGQPTPAHAAPVAAEDGVRATAEGPSDDLVPGLTWTPVVRVISAATWAKSHPRTSQFDLDSRQPFRIDQARIKLRVRWGERLRVTLSGDLDADPPIRSAFAEYRFDRAFRLRAGRFKRPMSRVELISVGRLPFWERGHFNTQLIERAGWGDRALGLMARGNFKGAGLRYAVAAMNAAPAVDVPRLEQQRGVDALGRLEWSPVKPLSVALNGGHKILEARADGPNLSLNAFGGDVQWKARGLRIVLEAIAAQNPFPPTPPSNDEGRTPWALGLMGFASYVVDLGQDLDLQPAVVVDWTDTDLDIDGDTSVRVVAACNLRWRKTVRLMPQVAVIQPLGPVGARSRVAQEVYRLALSVEL